MKHKMKRPTRCFFCGQPVTEHDRMVYADPSDKVAITFHDWCGLKFAAGLTADCTTPRKLQEN